MSALVWSITCTVLLCAPTTEQLHTAGGSTTANIPDSGPRRSPSARRDRRSRHPIRHQRGRLQRTAAALASLNAGIANSHLRVKFSARKPTLPPWPVATSYDASNMTSPRHAGDRTKRNAANALVPACDSVSEWVQLSQVEDIWGNTLSVLQQIEVGGAIVNQFFYETFCQRADGSAVGACRGIDSTRYTSTCVNKYVWTYAKVTNRHGEVDWSLVRVRGSCNCALRQVKNNVFRVFRRAMTTWHVPPCDVLWRHSVIYTYFYSYAI